MHSGTVVRGSAQGGAKVPDEDAIPAEKIDFPPIASTRSANSIHTAGRRPLRPWRELFDDAGGGGGH
jgi:hypothetical protein